ncbi:MAG: Rne/Rng family ribonuclease [Cyanobacteria bacterium J06641_5]
MPKQIVIAEQQQVAAVFSEDRIEELVVAHDTQQVGDVYLGTVENVIPGIDAAFVNIGDAERNGFMHVTDLGPLKLKRSGAITELLAPQQKVVVQIMKEPTGNKGPRLTGNVTFPGRYLVLMPYSKGVSLSRHIENDNERGRLRALAILIKPAGMGLIVRTEAEEQSEEDIIKDLEALKQQWESIQQQANEVKPPVLLNRDDDFIQRVLRDVYTADVNRVVVDTASGLKRVKQQLATWNGGRMPAELLVEHHRDRLSILEYFRVNAAIREAIKPRVDLPSGGYIIIEPTEALTVVDVNSGSFTRSATSRETVLWTNCEAAVEIARQLRLRKIGGVIIVDFIDMDSRRDQLKVLEIFNQALKTDKARPQIVQLSELGLVELTRKRQGQSLYEVFGRPCSTCGGLGHLVHLPGSREMEALVATTAPPPAAAAAAPAAKVIALPTVTEKRGGQVERLLPLSGGATEGEPELDLLHHPSYQEQNSSGGNNRRRRRRDGSTRSERPESGPKGRQRGSSGTNTAVEEGAVGRSRVEGAPPPELAPAREAAVIETRARPEPAAPEAPTKTLTVPMTALEQDVYALMGLSPLVRLDDREAIPDAGKAIILPVDPDAPELVEVTALVNGGNGSNSNDLALTNASEGTEISDTPSAEAAIAVAPPPEDLEVPEASEPEPSEEPASEPSEERLARSRRRRRRSSAPRS